VTRSFDRRQKEEPVSLELDCMCEKNDPECTECWTQRQALALDNVESDPFGMDVAYRFNECRELLLRKHKDYGPANIANAPGGPLNGLRVRMHDKLARINHLIDTGALPENESLRDSLVDLCNYSLIGLMVIDERWPTE